MQRNLAAYNAHGKPDNYCDILHIYTYIYVYHNVCSNYVKSDLDVDIFCPTDNKNMAHLSKLLLLHPVVKR